VNHHQSPLLCARRGLRCFRFALCALVLAIAITSCGRSGEASDSAVSSTSVPSSSTTSTSRPSITTPTTSGLSSNGGSCLEKVEQQYPSNRVYTADELKAQFADIYRCNSEAMFGQSDAAEKCAQYNASIEAKRASGQKLSYTEVTGWTYINGVYTDCKAYR
jgi:hypothetical protein